MVGFYGISVVICPGLIMEMQPPKLHIHILVSLRVGKLPINTVGDPGVHGAVVTGRHATGVSTPLAAAVAAATAGFCGELHMPKLGMLTNGW
jgi:hypothetical protein